MGKQAIEFRFKCIFYYTLLEMSLRGSWKELFTVGKWEDCAHAIHQELNGHKIVNDVQQHSLRIILENNKFVCHQLSKDWDSFHIEDISRDWAKSHSTITELFHVTHCQHTCSKIPLNVLLCVTSNAMWWSIMKIDPLQQHSCSRETLLMASSTLKTVSITYGVWNVYHHSLGSVENDFLQAVKNISPYLLKLSPKTCYLAVEIIVLGLLSWLNEESLFHQPLAECLSILDEINSILPQIRVHLSNDSIDTNFESEDLVKFGWLDNGEFLSKANLTVITEAWVIVETLICLREKTDNPKKSNLKALSYLKLVDLDNSNFSALIHYMKAFAHFNNDNLDRSLCHLQQTSFSTSSLFMQSRVNTLKGQIYLLQNKPTTALEALQTVDYKHKEVQIPLSAYLITKAYGKLGKVSQQCKALALLSEYLSTESSVHPILLSPVSGMEHRILLDVHSQPEISYDEVLRSSAKAHLSNNQPKEAAEKLMELLHINSVNFDCVGDKASLWQLSELLHDTAATLLEAQSAYDAQQVCEAAVQFFSSQPLSDESTTLGIESMKEDIIALLLLAHAKDTQHSSDVNNILNRCAKVLQDFVDKTTKDQAIQEESVLLCRALLARTYLHKAILNLKKKFSDDAVACFQRALSWKTDDPEVILHFIHALLENNKFDECLALWEMYKDAERSTQNKSESIAINYLLGDRMGIDDREEVICRIQSLSTS